MVISTWMAQAHGFVPQPVAGIHSAAAEPSPVSDSAKCPRLSFRIRVPSASHLQQWDLHFWIPLLGG